MRIASEEASLQFHFDFLEFPLNSLIVVEISLDLLEFCRDLLDLHLNVHSIAT